MAQQFELKALIIGIDKLSPMLRGIQKNLGGFRRELNSFGKGGLEMGAALAGGIGLASKAFADFEDAGLRLKSAFMGSDGGIASEFQKVNELAMQLGNKLPGNTADFQNMMTSLVQQGVTGQEILSGIGEAAAFLGVQLKMAPEAAAEFAAKMRTATGTAGKDMMALMDVIQKTSNLGVRSDDMLQGFSKLTPALDTVKVKGLEAGKAFAPLLAMSIRSGMAGEAAGNAYRKVFQAFFDPAKLKMINAQLAPMKKHLEFTNGKGEFGGLDKMFASLEQLKSLTTEQRLPLIKKLFGDDSETLQVVSTLIEKGKSGYDEMLQKMAAQASLQQRVESQLSSLKNMFDAALGNAQNLLAAVGEAFSPQIKSLVDALGGFASWAQDFVKNNPGVIRSLAGMATALVGVKLAALGIATAMGLVSAVMKTSPLGLAITALALGASLIMENWKPIVGFFKDIWSALVIVYGPYVEKIMSLINKVIAPVRWMIDMANVAVGMINGGGGGGGSGQPSMLGGSPVQQAIAARNLGVNGTIGVSFANAPRGMRVDSVQASPNINFGVDVGYSSIALGMP